MSDRINLSIHPRNWHLNKELQAARKKAGLAPFPKGTKVNTCKPPKA